MTPAKLNAIAETHLWVNRDRSGSTGPDRPAPSKNPAADLAMLMQMQ